MVIITIIIIPTEAIIIVIMRREAIQTQRTSQVINDVVV